jgi:hypothetical protein
LADVAVHLYAGFACAVRAAEALAAGRATAGEELAVARHAIHRAGRQASSSLAALDANDDDIVSEVARMTTARARWDFDIVP